jgi:hypothetical protein
MQQLWIIAIKMAHARRTEGFTSALPVDFDSAPGHFTAATRGLSARG